MFYYFPQVFTKGKRNAASRSEILLGKTDRFDGDEIVCKIAPNG